LVVAPDALVDIVVALEPVELAATIDTIGFATMTVFWVCKLDCNAGFSLSAVITIAFSIVDGCTWVDDSTESSEVVGNFCWVDSVSLIESLELCYK
jgi:hypothetical protein